VVGETNDGTLNDIRGMHVQKSHIREALAKAAGGAVEEGSVGAGTGTVAFGFKGGIGTSSRVAAKFTVGVLVQTNFGGVLAIDGLPVGKELNRHMFSGRNGDGSCMAVVATDAPLDSRQLKRIAKRAMLGVARTGSPASNGSGEYAIAFSVAPGAVFPDDAISPLFEATVEATEEAIYNSLFKATTTTGFHGATIEALPIAAVKDLMQKHRYPAGR